MSGYTTRVMILLGMLIAEIALAPRTVSGADYKAQEVAAIDGKVTCFAQTYWWITTSTRRCNQFTAPEKFAVGTTFAANGKPRQIEVIIASQADRDMIDYGMDFKKGEWYCVAAETPADLDPTNNGDRLWLYIAKCQPTRLSSAPTLAEDQHPGIAQPVTVSEFMQFPEAQQAIYVGGIIEGMAFVSYGNAWPDYPKWVACVRSQSLGDTTKQVVALIEADPSFGEVSSALAKALGKRCKH